MQNKLFIDFNKCLKQKTKLKHFTWLRVSFYCDHKQMRTWTYASVHIYKTKGSWND